MSEQERERVRAEGGGVPMDLDALRYMGTVTSPIHRNVQFDRHLTEGGVAFRRFGSIETPHPGDSRGRERRSLRSPEGCLGLT